MIAELKPYAEYRDVEGGWLGRIPSHWAVKRMKYVVREVDWRSSDGTEQLLRVSQYTGVTPRVRADGLDGADTRAESLVGYKRVEPNDLVINIMLAWNGSMGVSRYAGIASPAYCVYRFSRDANPWYFHQLLRSPIYRARIKASSTGVVESRLRLYTEDLGRIEALVPPPDEQAAIVRFLDWANGRLERAIRAKRKVIALLNEQKQSVIHRAITGHLQHSTEAMTPGSSRWFPAIPNKWEALPMRRVLRSAIDGPHFSPQYVDEGIPFLSARNIRADRWSLSDVKYITEADYREFSKRVKPERGDVLYTKGGTTGVARAVDLDFRFQVWVHVAVLKLQRDRIDPGYLAYCLNSSRCYEQAQLFTRGATNQDLGLGRMKDIELPVPESLELQRLIVATLDAETASLVSATDKLSREIELLREYQSSLIADTVAGRVDVQGVAQSLPRTPEGFGPGLEIDAEPESEELQQ